MHFSGAKNCEELAFIIVILIIIQLTSSSCPYHHGNIKCDCDANKIECSGMQNYELEIQDILANISSVENVVIKVSGLQFEPDFVFKNMTTKNMTLGYGLESPPLDLFSELGSSLVSLNLNNNSIGTISEQLFSSLSSLTALYLDFNELLEMEPNMFTGLINLNYLSVASNSLNEVNPSAFQHLLLLRSLLLSHNNISDFKNANIKSSSLIVLKMDGCLIQGPLNKDTFSDLPNLEELDLSYNRISEVKPHSLASMKNLQHLNLSHNVIEFLQENAFIELSNLTTLDLKDNKISMVKVTSFSGLLNLKYMDLSRNRLKAVLCDYTTDLAALERINLQDNEIKVFTTGAFYYSPVLKELLLTGNNLECSCELTDTAYYLIENSTMSKKDLDSVFCIVTSTLGYMSITDYKSSKCIPEEPCKKLSHSLPEDDEDYDYDYSDESTVSSTALITTLNNTAFSTETTQTTTEYPSSYPVTTIEIVTPSETVSPSENNTYIETTSVSETSAYPKTTSVSETSTYPETTSVSETSTYPKTTSVSETSIYPETTSVSETSTYPETTSVSETSTYPETTSLSETSTYPETASVSETSTYPETASVSETSAYPEMTSASDNSSYPKTTPVFETTSLYENSTHSDDLIVHDSTTANITSDIIVIGAISTTLGDISYENYTDSTTPYESEGNLTAILEDPTQNSIETSSVISSSTEILVTTINTTTNSASSPVKTSTVPSKTVITTLTTKQLCNDVELFLDRLSLGTDTGVVKNFTFDGTTFCLKWTVGGFLPPKSRCIIKYTFIKGVKSENLECPKFPGDIKLWSKTEKVYKFCLNIYGASIGGSCIKVSEKTTPAIVDTTVAISTTDSTMFTPESENLTVETSAPSTTAHSETPTYSVTESTIRKTTAFKIQSTVIVATGYPFIFNVTSFDIHFNDSSFVFVKWTVNAEEPTEVCSLALTVTTQYFDYNEGAFPCRHHTHKLLNVRDDDIFKLCLAIHHTSSGHSTVCRYSLAGADIETEASRRETSTSRASYFVPLICLLVFMILVVMFLFFKNIFKNRQESDRYDVRAEEEKSERVQIRSSSSVEQSSVRYSYVAKEDSDV